MTSDPSMHKAWRGHKVFLTLLSGRPPPKRKKEKHHLVAQSSCNYLFSYNDSGCCPLEGAFCHVEIIASECIQSKRCAGNEQAQMQATGGKWEKKK